MPAVPAGSLVLVTGASAFIAVHVVQQLLDSGYHVRGTVRSDEKGEWLVNKFKGKPFTYVIVEDLEKEDGFDEAVKDCDAIQHIASPFHTNVTDPYKDLINPALNGTLSVLKSAKKHGNKVRRIVITSSYASVVDSSAKPVTTFTEADWNETSPKVLKEKGNDCPPIEVYRSSKTLAERAAWKFIEEEKPQFDIATVMPPFVLGPIIHQCKKPDALNTSVAGWYAYLSGKKGGEGADGPAGNMVDVREVARAHVECIKQESAGNNRWAITNCPFTWQQALDVANADENVKKAFPKLPTGTAGSGDNTKQNIYDGTKSKTKLGIQYHSFKDSIIDMSNSLAEYQAAGWS